MERNEKYKALFIVIGTTLGIITGAYFAFKLQSKDMPVLIAAGLVFIPSMLGLLFSNKLNKLMELFKKGQSENKNEIKEVRTGLENINNKVDNVIITITEKDLEDAKNFEIYHTAITDLDDKWQAKKEISMLGKSMQNISKKIMNKHFDVNNELKNFLIKITESVKEYVISEYEYGLDLLDLEDYEILLFDKVNTVAAHIDFMSIKHDAFESVKCAVDNNIHKYIKDLNGIQDLRNGQRRERFEQKTIEFITNSHHQSFEAYNKVI